MFSHTSVYITGDTPTANVIIEPQLVRPRAIGPRTDARGARPPRVNALRRRPADVHVESVVHHLSCAQATLFSEWICFLNSSLIAAQNFYGCERTRRVNEYPDLKCLTLHSRMPN
ncbi:hypothetical protein EVAR_61952_1 [Eumeta japonica]|uniref:Uncharacterized protein n=1 Tax=Eumeta variegata TaxID=151549 RepID=A0A4C1ZM03_EUMVA|nr:hypothetical protein EVAR_61952_1 [Eumeta japonica]